MGMIKELSEFDARDCDAVFTFITKKYFGIFSAMQIKNEFIKLLKRIERKHPKYVLEVGTANGGALFCFAKLASDDAVVISIDLPEGKFGGGYEKWRAPFFGAFRRNGQKIFLLREDSHAPATLERVKEILGGRQLDFLFIDGDHTYSGVKQDFDMYRPLVKKGGVVAFHDIVDGFEEYVGGVPRFWRELKVGCDYEEFVQDWEQGGYGIGILSV